MTHPAIKVMVFVLFGMVGLSGPAAAVSYYPGAEDQHEVKATKGIREKGEIVCLFQSGTEDVRKTIGIGDILIVYREGGDHENKQVGRIKVLSYSDEDYIKAEVVDGTVQTGDVAKKGSVASLVIDSSERCK